jgi:medium-chain acyl-[acyl-carrier-protein] hydrolase
MEEHIFKEKYSVYAYEVDTNANAPITAIANYIQDIAAKHAEVLGWGFEDMLKKHQYWVLYRLRIDMKRYPVWREEVVIETWPSGIYKLFANRDFRITDKPGNVIGNATSAWLIIDRRSRRPQSPESLHETLPGLDVSSDRKSVEKLPSVPGRKDRKSYRVKYSDLDQNHHVNNVKYIQWIIDSYPDDFCAKNRIVNFEINYLSESSLGDIIGIESICLNQSPLFYHHALFIADPEKEICRARVTWEHML